MVGGRANRDEAGRWCASVASDRGIRSAEGLRTRLRARDRGTRRDIGVRGERGRPTPRWHPKVQAEAMWAEALSPKNGAVVVVVVLGGDDEPVSHGAVIDESTLSGLSIPLGVDAGGFSSRSIARAPAVSVRPTEGWVCTK